MILWIDVEDLFHYALANSRPSGIQRLSFELYTELQALLGDRVRFCRHDPAADTLRTVPWSTVRGLFAGLLQPTSGPDAPARADQSGPNSGPTIRQRRFRTLRRLAMRLPPEMREILMHAVNAQRTAIAAQRAVVIHGGRLLRAASSELRRHPARSKSADAEAGNVATTSAPVGEDIRDLLRPGDVFSVIGSPWFHADYAGLVSRVTSGRDVRIALLIYDLIPLLRPEWCDAELVRVFNRWVRAFIPLVDHAFAISDFTARDVERWSIRESVPLRMPVRTLPIGTGFSNPLAEVEPFLPAGLVPGGYALLVSTVEARKNHLLAFRAWRQMVEEMPAETVPKLVFAGRVGWLVQDLMQQLENCRYLDGKVVLVSDPTDAELTALYSGCRFTLFPSLYEGWGLPVTESLSFGKLCVASDRTSIPEAGGRFCLYVNPEDISGATETIRRVCTDDVLLAEREAAIRDGFRPVPWRRSAEVMADHLGLLRASSPRSTSAS